MFKENAWVQLLKKYLVKDPGHSNEFQTYGHISITITTSTPYSYTFGGRSSATLCFDHSDGTIDVDFINPPGKKSRHIKWDEITRIAFNFIEPKNR